MKHKLTVCCGTTCYLLAGNRIDRLEQLVKQKFDDTIEVVPSACLGQCMKHNRDSEQYPPPPFVKFDNEIISNATNDNVIKAIKNRLS